MAGKSPADVDEWPKRHRGTPSAAEIDLGDYLPPSFIHTGQDAASGVIGFLPDYQDRERRLIVEMDGHWSHHTPDGLRQSKERDLLLEGEGWRVLHIGGGELRHPAELLRRINEFIDSPETQGPQRDPQPRRPTFEEMAALILDCLECLRCGYRWLPRRAATPRSCPVCKSYRWNEPRQPAREP